MLFQLVVAAALAAPLFAFDDDRHHRNGRDGRWSRNDRDARWSDRRGRNNGRNNGYGYGRDRYPYGTNRGPYGYPNNSGYGRQDAALIDRALRNVQSAASRNRVDNHERDHFSRAIRELQNMRYNQGGIDSRSLSRVLEDLEHLSRADQVHPRDRQLLSRDRQALSSLYGGYGSNRWLIR